MNNATNPSDFPTYTAQENLMRALLDSRNKYLVVEGEFDLPIYRELIENLKKSGKITTDPELVFGGGKQKMLEWLDKEDPSNTTCLLDMDFDSAGQEYEDHRIKILKRYSIENYFFDMEVVAPLITKMLCCYRRDLEGHFDLNTLFNNWSEHLEKLIVVLYYYQKKYVGAREEWTKIFIKEDRNWGICQRKVERAITKYTDDIDVEFENCLNEFNTTNLKHDEPHIYFPGKMLMESFFRYIKENCEGIKQHSTAALPNSDVLVFSLAPRLGNSEELNEILCESVA